MKKIISASLLALSFCALGYTSEDVSNATYLADQQIIVKQSTASKYRLDDKILRQEVIGMALKVKGITLPENYTCKKYFADATKNDWVCRAVELAADNGIITRSNKYANPIKDVTRSEALAILMKAGNITTTAYSGGPYPFTDIQKNSWQYTLVGTAFKGGIVAAPECDISQSARTCAGVSYGSFYPNKNATRAEVFGFAKNILEKVNASSSQDAFDENEIIKKVIGISGGTITNASGEFTVNIPAGAVQKDTEFTLSFKKSSFKVISGTGSPITFSLSPSETNFSEAISIKISYDSAYSLLVPYFIKTSGELQSAQLRNIDKTNHTFIMDTFHGGDYSWIYIQ